MTLEGTNTYVVGSDPAYVIDPGPADRAHLEVVGSTAADRGGIAGVLLTHSHADHSAGAPGLDAPLLFGDVGTGDEASGEAGVEPGSGSIAVAVEPQRVGPFEVIPTPGHAADHVCFVLGEIGFCGDLVLGHGSSFVPPDGGSLAAYLDSLERLREADLELLCPGHGPYIANPAAEDRRVHRAPPRSRARAAGRARRRGAIASPAARDRLGRRPGEMRPVAAVVMQAHLEKLEAEGRLPEGLGD